MAFNYGSRSTFGGQSSFGSFGGGSSLGGSTAAANNPNPNNDLMVPNTPKDSVSQMALNDSASGLIAASWDRTVSFWQIQRSSAQAVPTAQMSHEAPALCCAFASDGSTAFSGGADGKVKMWQLGSPSQTEGQIGAHDAPVAAMQFVPEINLLITGGWDKKIKAWDCRSPNPVGVQELPERCYCLSSSFPFLGVATAQRKLCFYNLQGGLQLQDQRESPLKYQSSCMCLFPSETQRPGFALGSVEGRVAIHYFKNDKDANFAFKCHRDSNPNPMPRIYAVNGLAFHSRDVFTTMGSDGKFHFWNKSKKTRLKGYESLGESITCGCFNKTGEIFAYSAGYDWREGAAGYQENQQVRIFLHAVTKEDIEGKPKNRSR